MPYYNLILQHDGYTGWQLGVISALRPFVSALFSPFWAAVADKYGIHRHIFLIAVGVTTVVCTLTLRLVSVVLLGPLIAGRSCGTYMARSCTAVTHSQLRSARSAARWTSRQPQIVSDAATRRDKCAHVQVRASLGILATPFSYLIIANICIEMFSGPTYVLSDTAIVSATLDPGDYGRCRFWACLAWGVSGMIVSPLMNSGGDSFAFIAYAAVSILGFIASCRLDFSFVNNDATEQLASARASLADNLSDAAKTAVAVATASNHPTPRRTAAGRRSMAHSDAQSHPALRIWANEAGLDPAMPMPNLPTDPDPQDDERQHHHDSDDENEPALLNAEPSRAHMIWTPRDGEVSHRSEDLSRNASPEKSVHVSLTASVTAPAPEPASPRRVQFRSGGEDVTFGEDVTRALLHDSPHSSEAGAVELADQPFWVQYGALLQEPRMIVFLTKALLMGVRACILLALALSLPSGGKSVYLMQLPVRRP